MKLAFIGTGIMGKPMAGHLLAAGHDVVVHTRTRARADDLFARGAEWADSPADAARRAEIVFICVPDTPDVQHAILGETGIIHAARPGLIVVDHSTISPTATQQMSAALQQLGVQLLDAPISGGDVGAINGTLSIMVGGPEAAFERVRPLLELMGKTITHTGASGTGQLTKLVNQILVSGTLMAVAEAMTFAAKAGLDAKRTIDAVVGGAARSWQLENLGPKMIQHDFRPGFMIDLMQKDLRLVAEWAEHNTTSLPGTSLVHQLFSAAQAAGHGKDGTQALFHVLERLAHLH